MKAKGWALEVAREAYEGVPSTNKLINRPSKITNSTSTDVTFGGSQSSRMVAKKQGCHSIENLCKPTNMPIY